MSERSIDSKYKIVAEVDRIEPGPEYDESISIKIVNAYNGNEIPEDEPLFIFRARDILSIKTIQYYLALCVENKCTDEQLLGIKKMIGEFHRWQVDNPDKMKQPGSTMPADMKNRSCRQQRGDDIEKH